MVFDALIVTSLFLIFAVPHSILASHKFKLALTDRLGNKIAFYRLFYNLSSILFFSFIYIVSPKSNYVVFDLPFPFDIIIVLFQIISGIILLWTTKYINIKEFLGLTQVKRFIDGTYKTEDLDEKLEFRIEGPFKYSRHPIYLFSSFFLILRPTMDFFYLIFLLNILLYFYIGSYFEEKKLVTMFGEAYRKYQKDVPQIFPKLNLCKNR